MTGETQMNSRGGNEGINAEDPIGEEMRNKKT
jgi:hypothetical protein